MMFNVLHRRSAAIRVFAAASVLALSACASSPESRFFTLAPIAPAQSASGASAPAALIDIQSVSVPAQVARNQLVVRRGETQVQVLENERWASPLSDEIRTALSIAATQRLSDFDAPRATRKAEAPVYHIAVDVQRFESWPGARVVIDATWSIRPSGEAGGKLTCRSAVVEPVAAGYDALVDGHRLALTAIAGQLAATVHALDAAESRPLVTATSRSSNPEPTVHCPSPSINVAEHLIPASGSQAARSRLAQ
ncbi:MAG TPA: PqiC family protein [Trinickia sp.]|uniref:PqiC family protein n=1 Tax=Trinickia sp. TaxID=2571163 RepID=UPI002C4E8D35|nr:PqiC family protein [Trinickia sp.]HVW52167.1 PqiC family protein [Trinickia sp.]